MKAFKIIGITLICFGLLLIIYNSIISIPKMEYRESEYAYIYQDHMDCPYTKSELKTLVRELFDTPHIYGETKRDSNSLIPFRIVNINNKLYDCAYVKQYAHELTHIKYQTKDERFVVYTTITTLYESGNEYLQWVAIDYANEFLTKSRPEKSYDCSYYLIEYFTFL